MALYSGKWLNDLGDYESCSRLPVAKYVLLFLRYEGPFLGIGFCGPQDCSVENYEQIIGNLTSLTHPTHPISTFVTSASATYRALQGSEPATSGIPVEIVFPSEREPTELSPGAVWMIAVCCCIGLLVVIATGLDAFHADRRPVKRDPGVYELMDYREKPAKGADIETTENPAVSVSPATTVILSFSLFRTVNGLFHVVKRQDGLNSLDGIRVLSIFSIVMGHLALVRVMGSVNKNPQDIVDYFKEMKAAPIYSAHFAVDTFFWLSGFLMAYGLLPKLEGLRPPSVWQVYLYRFLRICPLYMFVLFLTWTLPAYLVSGPRGFHIDDINVHCEKYWWTSLLFLHHQIPDWLGVGCLGQSWFLGTDMQIFWVLVPVLYLYHHRKAWGWRCFAGLCAVAVATSAYITWKYEFSVMAKSPENSENHYPSRYYVQPYTRCAPYVLGVVSAILYHVRSPSQLYDRVVFPAISILRAPIPRLLSLAASLGLGAFLVFIQCDAYQAIDDPSLSWSRSTNTVYIACHRLLWGLCLTVLLLPTVLGLHPLLQRFLSLSVWAPLSKLTFCVYLLHVHLILGCVLSQEAAVWFGDLSLLTDFCFVTVLSFAFALPLYLCVECPLNGVLRALKV